MENDPVAQDAATLLLALVRNHTGAVRGASFTLTGYEPQRFGLEQPRFDNAMWWLIKYGFVERDEESEDLLSNVAGLTEYDYGLAFKITDRGRELLRGAGAGDPS